MFETIRLESLFRLDDKVCVITGASSGFGTRFARLFAAAGSKVVLAARRVERLEALAAELPDAIAVGCDVGDDEQCRSLVQRALDQYGRVDVLVNNAGISDGPHSGRDPDMGRFRRVIEINLSSCFLLSGLVARDMLPRRAGSIINVASIHGLVGSAPNLQPAYAASKAGLVNLSRELALEWAKDGVRVNALCPGYFETELTEQFLADESGAKWVRRNTPIGRPGARHELDGAALFLASDSSTYMTGATLTIDGGWTAR